MQVQFGDLVVNVNYEYYLNLFHLLENKIIITKTENRRSECTNNVKVGTALNGEP